MISHQKHVSVVTLVVHVSKNAQITRVAAGNPQKNARPIATKSGAVVNALVVSTVDHARESVRKTMDVASRKQDGANETVKKGLE